MLGSLRNDLKQLWNPQKGDFLQKFFRVDGVETGDIFRGVSVPQSRAIAKKYHNLPFEQVHQLLTSKVHEERLIALFILVGRYKRGDQVERKQVFEFYLAHVDYINHWDLVDSSADRILGDYLKDKKKNVLYEFAGSDFWWIRRIAILATFQFLKDLKDSNETYKIAEILINDPHDLVQKGVGWMLRESGEKVSEQNLEMFLKKHYKTMPRIMLRYSIEKFSEEKRKKYLKGQV